MTSTKPNILFIIIDSARIDHFSIYGYNKPTTPFLDSVADDFVVYDNASTPAGWTRPAMTSIFTALYPEQYGFFDKKYLGEDMPILSEMLQRQGYTVTMLSNNAYMSPATGFQRGTDRFYYVNSKNFYNHLDKDVIAKNIFDLSKQYINKRTCFKVFSQMLNDQAKKTIYEDHASSRPFFIYIHHDAHHPYLSDRRYLNKFIGRIFSEEEIKEVETIQRSGDMYRFNKESIRREKRERYYQILQAMHDASIYKNDIMIQDLARTLKSNGIYDNTMIIISADHGEFLGEREFVSHGLYLYEEVVKVPLLIKYPKEYNMHGLSDRLISTIDILPTISDLVGDDMFNHNEIIQGISLLSSKTHEFIVCQKKNFSEGLAFWMDKYPDHSFQEYDLGNLTCLKNPKEKFIASSKGMHSLFNLQNDPGEINNLYSSDDTLCQSFLKKYKDWIESIPKIQGSDNKEFDEQMKEQLRGLGYIE